MTVDSYERLDVKRDGPVAAITLDGAGAFNSLDGRMTRELRETAVELAADDAVRCITITGAGDAFCAGADLSKLAGDASDETTIRRIAGTLHDAVSQFHYAPKPVVTGINGPAAGGGFGLAIMGDLVLVSDEARLEFAYPRIGLTGDGGATFFLPRIVGHRRAMEIVLDDEPIGPAEAVDLGLATEVVPAGDLDDRLAERAAALAAGPTAAYARTKRLLAESFDRDLEGQMAAETDAMAAAVRTEDFSRGHAAFFGDEDPEFTGQ
jgi:2-(1,2-epoxy-1,2-dihydrophenyl)acetyl-CoA isomerase